MYKFAYILDPEKSSYDLFRPYLKNFRKRGFSLKVTLSEAKAVFETEDFEAVVSLLSYLEAATSLLFGDLKVNEMIRHLSLWCPGELVEDFDAKGLEIKFPNRPAPIQVAQLRQYMKDGQTVLMTIIQDSDSFGPILRDFSRRALALVDYSRIAERVHGAKKEFEEHHNIPGGVRKLAEAVELLRRFAQQNLLY